MISQCSGIEPKTNTNKPSNQKVVLPLGHTDINLYDSQPLTEFLKNWTLVPDMTPEPEILGNNHVSTQISIPGLAIVFLPRFAILFQISAFPSRIEALNITHRTQNCRTTRNRKETGAQGCNGPSITKFGLEGMCRLSW